MVNTTGCVGCEVMQTALDALLELRNHMKAEQWLVIMVRVSQARRLHRVEYHRGPSPWPGPVPRLLTVRPPRNGHHH